MSQADYTIKPENYKYDNVDDNKEIFNLISNFMDVQQRKEFLEWCCSKVGSSLNRVLRPGLNSTFHEREVFWQMMSLAHMHGLSLKEATQRATDIARKKA